MDFASAGYVWLPKEEIALDDGKEFQRCLYAFAVKALLGNGIEIAASLLYLRDRVDLQLGDPAASLEELSGYLQTAHANLRAGRALMGPD